MNTNDLIYITTMPEDQMRALKAMRNALKLLDPNLDGKGALEGAQVFWDLFHKDGFTFFGMVENNPTLTHEIRQALLAGHIVTQVNIDPIALAAALDTTPDEPVTNVTVPAPPADTERQAKTGISLISWTDGDPISACAHAASLGRTTGDLKFYSGVIVQIADAFPWIVKMLKEQGIIE